MNEREELQALRRLAELEAKAAGDQRVANLQANYQKNNPIAAAQVALIGAGRQGDKLLSGVKEMGLSANVAAREGMGMESGEQLRKLAELEQVQQGNDAAYAPLAEKHPFLTGAGESAFLAAAPMGQATAVGRIAAPAAIAAVNELLSYGSPKERGLQALEKGAVAAVGGGVGEGVRALVSPAKSSLSAAQQQAVKRASETIGYKPRASELTGNETLRRLEDAVARQPGGSGPMRDFIEGNERAISRHAAKGIGEKTDELTDDVMANASERLGSTYNELRGMAAMPVTDDVFSAVARAEKMLTTGDVAHGSPKGSALMMVQRLKEKLYESKQFDGETYQAWTSDLSAAARELGKQNRTAAAALREVERAMDKVARGPNAPAWREADKQFANLETLMKPGVVNTQTGKVSQLKLASQMERQFGKNMKTGKIKGELADIASLARAMPPMHEGSQTAGREAFGGLPGWLMAAPNYAAAKGLTSEFGRDYLSRGLLGSPKISRSVGGLLGRGAVPMTMAELEALLLGYQ